MLEMRAVLTCDRCLVTTIEMENLEDREEVWQRMRETEAGWSEDEDGADICPACWAKLDDRRSEAAQAVDAVDPSAEVLER